MSVNRELVKPAGALETQVARIDAEIHEMFRLGWLRDHL